MSGASVKVVILGDSSVGKTSLIQRYISGRTDIQNSTLGAVFVQLKHSFTNEEGELVKFPIQCWDTAGQERYHSLIPMYVRDADFIIMAFDLTDQLTFKNLDKWVKLSKECIKKSKFLLVGCKNDLPNYIPLKDKEISNFIKDNMPGSQYFSTSSVTGNNVKEVFKHIKKELEEIGGRRYLLNDKLKNTLISLDDRNIENSISGQLNKCCF